MKEKELLVLTVKEIEVAEDDIAKAIYFTRGGRTKELAVGALDDTSAYILCMKLYGSHDMKRLNEDFNIIIL